MRDPNEVIGSRPRVRLGHWPTPLEPCDALHARTGGARIWLKRDDCSGLAVGGNKTRKLEFLLGEAVAEGADGVITFGALQSNHARQTAAACARLGLSCDLVLTRAVPRTDEHYLHSGNLLLDRLLGARLHLVEDADAAFVRFAELYEAAEQQGRRPFAIAPGGSEPTGVLGYVTAALELSRQLRDADVHPRRIVVPASTAGTAAGLALGCELAGIEAVLDVVCVYEPAEVTAPVLADLIRSTADRFDLPVPAEDRWSVTDATLGGGYGVPTAEAQAAIELLARTEGVLLDPVYTAKAFAHLLGTDGDRDGDVVFVHTGGSPGLFAYTPEFDELDELP